MAIPVAQPVPIEDEGVAGFLEDVVCANPISWVSCKIGDAAAAVGEKVGTTVAFADDPGGWLIGGLQNWVTGFAGVVMNEIMVLINPSMDADWFKRAYLYSFSVAVIAVVVLYLWNQYQLSRRAITIQEYTESMTLYPVAFFGFSMFAPGLIGWLADGMGKLATDAFTFGLGEGFGNAKGYTSAAGAAAELIKIGVETGSGREVAGETFEIAGGQVFSIVMLLLLGIALTVTVLILLVQVVAIYFLGVLLPLSFVWLINPLHRSKGMKLLLVLFGILFSQVLLFFLLGVAFQISGGAAQNWTDKPGLQILFDAMVAFIALGMAAIAPYALLKLGKDILPTSAGSSTSRGAGTTRSQMSSSGSGSSSSMGDLSSSLSSKGGSGGGVLAGSSGGGSGGGSSGSTSSVAGTGSGGGPKPGIPSPVGGGSSMGSMGGAAAKSGAAAQAGTAATAGLTATGVGAPVAAGLAGGKKLMSITADLSRKAADQVAGQQDHDALPPDRNRG